MSAMNLCEYLHTSHAKMMPGRRRYVPASATGETSVQRLDDQWLVKQYACSEVLPEYFYMPEFDEQDFEPTTAKGAQAHAARADYVYRHAFSFQPDPERPRVYLVFESGEQLFHVWLNGKFLGSSRDGRCEPEFDVSDSLRAGANTLTVLVPAQAFSGADPFRGICGSGYLLKRPKNHIWDFTVSTEIREEARVMLHASFAGTRQAVSVRLLDAEGRIAAEGTFSERQILLRVEDPILWSPEKPYLYTLLLESCGEQIRTSLAMRKLTTDGTGILLNGIPLKLCGTSGSHLTLRQA